MIVNHYSHLLGPPIMNRNGDESVLPPRQERSQRSQERVLEALESLLQERFFEQITIQDLADEAGVAVGTVYRRFRNKEALLPVLYQRLDDRLGAWAAKVWRGYAEPADGTPDGGLRAAIGRLVSAHVRFYRANAPMLRTLYLQARLDGELIEPERARRRQRLYGALLTPVWACFEHPRRHPRHVRPAFRRGAERRALSLPCGRPSCGLTRLLMPAALSYPVACLRAFALRGRPE